MELKLNRLVLLILAFGGFFFQHAHAQNEVDSVRQELVLISAGEFLMGNGYSPAETASRFPEVLIPSSGFMDEYPQHLVKITKSFLLSKHEVTVGQFKRFVADTGYKTEAERDGLGGWGYNPVSRKTEGRHVHFNWQNTGYPQTDQHPVVNVSYNDAQAYLAWLSKKEGKKYRLPTEAEWEYANRAGTSWYYSNSNNPDDIPQFARAIDLSQHKVFMHVQDMEVEPTDATVFPVPVGSYKPNAWGLHDMHGNVWEWVQDWYGEDYYAKSPVSDPQGPETGSSRVRRGGGWNSFPVWLRSSFRNTSPPDTRCSNLGFRVARDL